jgi:hypothetical protein
MWTPVLFFYLSNFEVSLISAMLRKARIDLCGVALAMTHAQGALHHIIIRGIKRKAVFKDCADRDNFIERLGQVISESKPDCDTRHRSASGSLS